MQVQIWVMHLDPKCEILTYAYFSRTAFYRFTLMRITFSQVTYRREVQINTLEAETISGPIRSYPLSTNWEIVFLSEWL